MEGARFSKEQIIAVLRQQGGPTKIADACRNSKVSSATLYAWKV